MPDYRWQFFATLETLSPLHVGDGGSDPARLPAGDGSTQEVATVFVDHSGRAYLPATSLKGWLRAFAERRLDSAAGAVQSLFGHLEAAGRLRVFDAPMASGPSREQLASGAGVYWDPVRGTCVSSHVVIDRCTRTAKDELLFAREYVPQYSRFHLRFEVDYGDQTAAANLYYLLTELKDSANGAGLAAHVAAGWGNVQIVNLSVSALSAGGIRAWAAEPPGAPLPFRSLVQTDLDTLLATAQRGGQESATLRYTVRVRFDGAFASNDTSRIRHRNDPAGSEKANLEPRRLDGKPYLPHSSFHGALRSQAEKIQRTLTGTESVDSISKMPSVLKFEDCGILKIPSLLFGAPGWRSPVRVVSQKCLNSPELIKQEMIAIDRFTGGGAPGRKFDSNTYWKPELELKVEIDIGRLHKAAGAQWEGVCLLLGLTLRDLSDGLIPLGAGAAKGYGRCTAWIEPNGPVFFPGTMPNEITATLSQPIEPRPMPALDISVDTSPMATPRSAGAGHFFNPYHFVPLETPEANSPKLSWLDQPGLKLTLDRYHKKLLTGYFNCCLTAETPFVIGGEQDKKAVPATVEPFKRETHPAIPASTLRGLISSQHEALTKSALRVLDNTYYSRRKEMKEALHAIGVVVTEKAQDGGIRHFIVPLCLPIFRPGGLSPFWRDKAFRNAPVMKTYIGLSNQVRDPLWLVKHPTWKPGQQRVPMAVSGPLSWTPTGADVAPMTALKIGGDGLRLAANQGATMTKGIWRCLGGHDDRDLPSGKTHELFIPVPNVAVLQNLDRAAPGVFRVSLPPEVVDRFHHLADQMTLQWRDNDGENVRPFVPFGTRPSRCPAPTAPPGTSATLLRIQAGDLVYFDVKQNGGEWVVSDISFSSVWRAEIPGRAYDFFQSVSPDLLPMSDIRRGLLGTSPRRDEQVLITPSEKLFGFVEDRTASKKRELKPSQSAAALASRVSFTDGIYRQNLLPESPFDGPVKLKILSSPKTPSPALYFQAADDGYVSKLDLGKNNGQRPRGRKLYLHHRVAGKEQPWSNQFKDTDNDNQRLSVTPIKRGAEFDFRVYFENLTSHELATLAQAIRPSPSARQKIGLGKPLGLGTVRIDVSAQACVYATARYTLTGLASPGASMEHKDIARPACTNHQLLDLVQTPFENVNYPMVKYLDSDPRTLETLRESKLFEWFVANDLGSGSTKQSNKIAPTKKPLRFLDKNVQPLPILGFRPPPGGAAH